MKKFVESFLYFSVSKKDVNYSNKQLMEGLAEFIDSETAGDAKTRFFEDNEVKNAIVAHDIDIGKNVPNMNLLLSNVNFSYSPTERALFTNQEVGFLALNGLTLNKMINSKIVWQFGGETDIGAREPDKLTILLEIDNYNYIFFEFYEYEAKVRTSYMDDVNTPLQLALDKTKPKSNEFHTTLATDEDVKNFRSSYKERFIEAKK
jgi:hypothetical protein